MNKCLIAFLLCGLFSGGLGAQAFSALIKNAERAAAERDYALAAELFERAGRLKQSDATLLYQAAENYMQIRDYLHAADGYRAAAPLIPLAPLRYARALKQQGRYAEAIIAFESFAQQYSGEHKEVMLAVADNEIAGCVLATQENEVIDTSMQLLPLQDSVNTNENEFAPLPFSDRLLYFSQASEKRVRLMRSKRKASFWGLPEEAQSLPEAVSAQFRSGTFSPDGARFYYAQCPEDCQAAHGGSARSNPCVLYCLTRTETGWSEPVRLRDYINLAGSTALFPQVSQEGGREFLFFSSDRPGGYGGLDLYVCERSIESDELDFSFPKNLGNRVNTGADEVTPFFDTDTKTLWFSSLGHPSLGGMDVFKTTLENNTWTKPQNAGRPINSPADDYYFVLKKRGEGAFLSSNRRIPKVKMSTSDDDLFEIIFQP